MGRIRNVPGSEERAESEDRRHPEPNEDAVRVLAGEVEDDRESEREQGRRQEQTSRGKRPSSVIQVHRVLLCPVVVKGVSRVDGGWLYQVGWALSRVCPMSVPPNTPDRGPLVRIGE